MTRISSPSMLQINSMNFRDQILKCIFLLNHSFQEINSNRLFVVFCENTFAVPLYHAAFTNTSISYLKNEQLDLNIDNNRDLLCSYYDNFYGDFQIF